MCHDRRKRRKSGEDEERRALQVVSGFTGKEDFDELESKIKKWCVGRMAQAEEDEW